MHNGGLSNEGKETDFHSDTRVTEALCLPGFLTLPNYSQDHSLYTLYTHSVFLSSSFFCFLLKSILSTTSGVFAKANRIDRKPRHPAVNGDINFKEYPDPSQNNEEKLWLVYNYNYFPPSSKVLFVYFLPLP